MRRSGQSAMRSASAWAACISDRILGGTAVRQVAPLRLKSSAATQTDSTSDY